MNKETDFRDPAASYHGVQSCILSTQEVVGTKQFLAEIKSIS